MHQTGGRDRQVPAVFSDGKASNSTGGLMRHESSDAPGLALNQGLAEGTFDESRAVDILLEPGQISLHHAMLVHGSGANRPALLLSAG